MIYFFILIIFFILSLSLPFVIIIFYNISLAIFAWLLLGSHSGNLSIDMYFLNVLSLTIKLVFYFSIASLHQLAPKCRLANFQRKLSPSNDSDARPMESLYSRSVSLSNDAMRFRTCSQNDTDKTGFGAVPICFPVRNPRLRSPLRRRRW